MLTDTDEFWIVGDYVAKCFARWGGAGHYCYIDTCDPVKAEKFNSYAEARKALKKDGDLRLWRDDQRDRKAMKPLRCRVQVAVYPPGVKP